MPGTWTTSTACSMNALQSLQSLALGIVTGCASQPHSETITHWCLVTEHSHLLMLWWAFAQSAWCPSEESFFLRPFLVVSIQVLKTGHETLWNIHNAAYVNTARCSGHQVWLKCILAVGLILPPSVHLVDIGFTHMIKYPRPTPAVLQVIKNWGNTSFLSRLVLTP